MAQEKLSRRGFLKVGTLGLASLASIPVLNQLAPAPVGQAQAHNHQGPETSPGQGQNPSEHTGKFQQAAHTNHSQSTVGDVDTSLFDPAKFLTEFDYGRVSKLPGGQTLREWTVAAAGIEIEVAPGVYFPAWAYNGQVPGPTFRCTEGDRLRFNFFNVSPHPHTIHFHGIHPPSMDGITPQVMPGAGFVYEFDAEPFGMHLYHCHSVPLARHIHKGLYGNFIIDPPGGRPPAKELSMVINAFDTNFDGENEVYAVNTVAFHYMKHPIQVKVGELVRIYVSNLTEFDPVNSFHLHSGMYKLYRTGTSLTQYEYTDNVLMSQGDRHIIEFTLKYPGKYMFHAHQTEFTELGWMGFFEAVE